MQRRILLLLALLIPSLTLACRGTVRDNVQQRVQERTGETAVDTPPATADAVPAADQTNSAADEDALGTELENLIEQLLTESDRAEPLPHIPEQ